MKVLAAASVAMAVAAPACAQERGTHLGFGLAQSRIHADAASIDAGVRRSGFATSSASVDEHDGAWKIYLGYRFNRNFALEGAHTDFGRFSLNTATTGPSANVGVRFEWERFVNIGAAATTGHGDIDLLGIGLQYRF